MDNVSDNEPVFETLLLDWIRTVSLFFIVGIALYHFTEYGKYLAFIAFLISGVMIMALIIDYIRTRKDLRSNQGIETRFSLDVLMASMIGGLALLIIIMYIVATSPPPKGEYVPIVEHLHIP